jgi:hypothetical protein
MKVILISGGAIQVKAADGGMIHCEPGVLVDIDPKDYERLKTRFVIARDIKNKKEAP